MTRPSLRPRRWSTAALAREASRHARFVGVMKLVLPLAALALVALVVGWPYLANRDDAGLRLTFATTGEDSDGQITMLNARYVGADRKARPFTITAERATQDPTVPERFAFFGVEADITLEQGTWIALRAAHGTYDHEQGVLDLLEDVALYSDNGYELATRDVRVDLEAGEAWGRGAVHGQGPLGSLDASGFHAQDGGKRLRFQGPVRITLYPAAGG